MVLVINRLNRITSWLDIKSTSSTGPILLFWKININRIEMTRSKLNGREQKYTVFKRLLSSRRSSKKYDPLKLILLKSECHILNVDGPLNTRCLCSFKFKDRPLTSIRNRPLFQKAVHFLILVDRSFQFKVIIVFPFDHLLSSWSILSVKTN